MQNIFSTFGKLLDSLFTNEKNNNDLDNNEIQEDLISSCWKLQPEMLDSRGNNKDGGWSIGEKRGGFNYIPPIGFVRYGLNVLGKYDGGNDDWISSDGRDGEWAIAYHGVACGQDSDNVKKIVGLIVKICMKPGANQAYRDDNDINHPGQKVGNGVYCSPDPHLMLDYAGVVNIGKKRYKVVLMIRVHPKKVRIPKSKNDYWIVSGTSEDTRPYGILLKEC